MDIEQKIEYLINRMFVKYYSGNELYGWQQMTYFGGGNIDNYKKLLRKLIDEGRKVKTGYRTSKTIRGSKTYYIFFK